MAIATGDVYRDIYERLGKAARKTPRRGVPVDIFAKELERRSWRIVEGPAFPFDLERMPKGIIIAHVCHEDGRCHHVCAIIDGVLHDTWDATDDDEYFVQRYWVSPAEQGRDDLPRFMPGRSSSKKEQMTQAEFDKVLRRLRALDRTASNAASTEAEKRNALRMMQQMMLNNNLTRDDIAEDDNCDALSLTRKSCYLNGRRACNWESMLAQYVCHEIFPTVQYYSTSKQHRTVLVFYGPHGDVVNSIALFREFLLTIAAAAQLNYGHYSRGPGASYCEGYVEGLPRASGLSGNEASASNNPAAGELIRNRMLAVHDSARQWLRAECNIRLTSSSRGGRHAHDPNAMRRGQAHGAQHQVDRPNTPKRLT